jgi:DNA-binding CsgD family transcriptional regulator
MAELFPPHDALYVAMVEGITSQPPWSAFAQKMRDMFKATHANVIFRANGSSQVFMAQASSVEIERHGDLTKLYDPVTDPIPYFEMQPFRCYKIEDFLYGQKAEEHPFVKNFLRPIGMEQLSICRVKTPSGMQAWLSVTRSGPCGFSETDQASLAGISRHFALALDLFGRLREAEDDRDAYARVVHAGASGMARLDKDGEIIHVDAIAKKWLDEGRIIRIFANRLSAVDPSDEAPLNEAVSRIMTGEVDEEFLVLKAGSAESLEVLLFKVSEPFEPAWTHVPRAIAYMRMKGQELLPSPHRLRVKFGLTRREAALAILIARGLTVGQASADLGISEQTGRAYLKQIFQKAGISRQSDLILHVHGSIGAVC